MRTKVLIYLLTLFISGLIFGYLLSQLLRGSLVLNLPNVLTPLILLATMVVLWQDLWRWRTPPTRQPAQPTPPPADNSSAIVITNGDTRIPGEILAKLTHDMTAATQLVEQAKRNHPGMPEEWYWQKVMDDLQRNGK